MKKQLLSATLFLPFLTAQLLTAQVLTQNERDRAVSELHASRKQLIDALSGLSPAQLSWKASDEKWSIADVAEHLATTEPFLLNFQTQSSKAPADPAKKSPRTDEEVLLQLRDRTTKISAPEPLKPKKAFASADAALAAFKERRDQTIRYVESTDVPDLRHKIVDYLQMDAYQMFLMIAAHTQRHVAQIAEVKASAGFPAK